MADDLDKLNLELDAAEVSAFETAVTTMKPADLSRVAGIVAAETAKRTPQDFASMSDTELHDWKYRNHK